VKRIAGQPPMESAEALVGRTLLDRYRVETVIGRGGMSVVFQGTDRRLERPVAIKVFSELFSESATRVSYQHFVQEAFALSKLNHPNTIRIFDFAVLEEDERRIPFQVSELMDGGTLGNLIQKRGAQAPPRAAHIMECLAGAVAEAHAHGIVHRDIKPSNILFGRAGKQRIVKLADFSVAQACIDASEAAVRSMGDQTIVNHASFWSLNWSAPEQIRGGPVDFRADIYGLGLMLAYILAGKPVWKNKHPSEYLQELGQLDLAFETALEALRLPAPLEAVCWNACRAAPAQRFGNAEQLHAAVEAAVRAMSPRAKARKVVAEPIEDSSPWIEATPAPPSDPKSTGKRRVSVVALEDVQHPDLLASGRRIKIREVGGVFDVETPARGENDTTGTSDHRPPIRLRFTLLPATTPKTRVHVRGLNCFLQKPDAVPTGGVDVAEDGEVDLVGVDRVRLGRLRVSLGEKAEKMWLVKTPDLHLSVPVAAAADLLVLGFSSTLELSLMYSTPKE
jgi:eukaryotic-like serine/threonine-protein kinase